MSVCLSVTNSQARPKEPLWCQPKAGTLACAGRRPAYMLVVLNGPKWSLTIPIGPNETKNFQIVKNYFITNSVLKIQKL